MKRFESPNILRMFGICVQDEDGESQRVGVACSCWWSDRLTARRTQPSLPHRHGVLREGKPPRGPEICRLQTALGQEGQDVSRGRTGTLPVSCSSLKHRDDALNSSSFFFFFTESVNIDIAHADAHCLSRCCLAACTRRGKNRRFTDASTAASSSCPKATQSRCVVQGMRSMQKCCRQS